MKWPKIALVALFLLAGIGLAMPWVTGIETEEWPNGLRWAFVGSILLAMFVLGRDERRKEKEADTWVDDPQRSKLENWMEKRRQRFSPKRGAGFFFLGLVAFSIMVGISALFGGVASVAGAVTFVLIVSVVAGLIGMFTEKVPL